MGRSYRLLSPLKVGTHSAIGTGASDDDVAIFKVIFRKQFRIGVRDENLIRIVDQKWPEILCSEEPNATIFNIFPLDFVRVNNLRFRMSQLLARDALHCRDGAEACFRVKFAVESERFVAREQLAPGEDSCIKPLQKARVARRIEGA